MVYPVRLNICGGLSDPTTSCGDVCCRLSLPAVGRSRRCPADSDIPVPTDALADDWAVSWRANAGRHRRARPAQPLLYRAGGWGSVEVGRLRAHLESNF